ncbi:uncharacterized protein FYW49_012805 [Xenentodon cancila]
MSGQVCFKDLLTVTADNSQDISRRLDSEHWIGLRKNFLPTSSAFTSTSTSSAFTSGSFTTTSSFPSNSTSNSSIPWSQWCNGDPITFQNWENATNVTPSWGSTVDNMATSNHYTSTTHSPWTTTTPTAAACERSPMLPPVVPETNKNYIDDPCVAMLSFGPWIEKSCLESLPFICYEDRFYGQINVTNVTVNGATLTWMEAPGDISHYRVEVKENTEMTENRTNLTTDLGNLTAGTRYTVQVFPVKCGRDMNPENTTFYTIPHKVKDLKVVNMTEKSVFLSWNKSDGNI